MPYKSDRHPNGVDPKDIVDGVVKDLGHERISYGHWKHSVLRYWIMLRQYQYWFNTPGKPAERFALSIDTVGEEIRFLKQRTTVDALVFNDNIISIKIPVKVDLKIKETAPAVKGNTSGNALKEAILETGAKVMVPLFINEGDLIRVNTESNEYTERVEKA